MSPNGDLRQYSCIQLSMQGYEEKTFKNIFPNKEESCSCPICRMCHNPYSSETCNQNHSLRLAVTASSKISSCHCDLSGLLSTWKQLWNIHLRLQLAFCGSVLSFSCRKHLGEHWCVSTSDPLFTTAVLYLFSSCSMVCHLLRKNLFLSVGHHKIYKHRVNFRDRALETLTLDFSSGVCL